MNHDELKRLMKEKGISIDELSTKTGINRATLFRRFQFKQDFAYKEVIKIASVLNLERNEVENIFMPDLSNI